MGGEIWSNLATLVAATHFFKLGLKRNVWKALSTTLGRWMGFLCSRSRLLVEPLVELFFFFLAAAVPRPGAGGAAAFSRDPSAAAAPRGTRMTQLEWRSCSLELDATV